MKLIPLSLLLISFSSTGLFAEDPPAKIDYSGFIQLTTELEPVRAEHQVTVERFMEMAGEENTIILDTRSADAFSQIHLSGAVHLNFSDFTERKLAKVIPDKNTRILIYCNNNFITEHKALFSKSLPLALNIPTFINLHGYGYENVYELKDSFTIDDPRLTFEGNSLAIVEGPKPLPNIGVE